MKSLFNVFYNVYLTFSCRDFNCRTISNNWVEFLEHLGRCRHFILVYFHQKNQYIYLVNLHLSKQLAIIETGYIESFR